MPRLRRTDTTRGHARRDLACRRSVGGCERSRGASTLAHDLLEGVLTTPAGEPVEEIRGAVELPRRAEDIELHTVDGLTLVGELSEPLDGPAAGTIVTFHPLPTHGGFMDSHLFLKAARRLPALADIAVVRFNSRGTSSPRGVSEGVFDRGAAEGLDLAAAVQFVADRGLPRPWAVGWSFGTDVVLKHGLDLDIAGALLLSPPLRWTTERELERWRGASIPLVAMIPELDDFLRPDEARRRFSVVPEARLIPVPRARHLWVGEKSTRIVLTEIVRLVNPERLPLPTLWPRQDQR